jgi:hypothetical protein
MPTGIFRINYYVAGMLAQGGKIWLDGSKICFSPTSAIDRAMGAQDVYIPFETIKRVDYTGVLSRAFKVITEGRTHKFEGGDAKSFYELLEQAMPNKELLSAHSAPAASGPAPAPANGNTVVPKASTGLVCDHCSKNLHPSFSFCPHCGTRIKTVCISCTRAMEPHWAACAFCGRKATAIV